jgi:hypothetical protein
MRGKGIFALRLNMSALDFATGPLFECAEDDASDIAFVNATHYWQLGHRRGISGLQVFLSVSRFWLRRN